MVAALRDHRRGGLTGSSPTIAIKHCLHYKSKPDIGKSDVEASLSGKFWTVSPRCAERNSFYSGKPLSIHALNWEICVFVRGGKGGRGIKFEDIWA